jgi:hypothetical protein
MRDVPRASSPRQRLKQNTAGDVVTQVRKTVYQNRTVYSACCLNFVVNPVVRSWLQLKKFDMLSLVSSYSLHYLYTSYAHRRMLCIAEIPTAYLNISHLLNSGPSDFHCPDLSVWKDVFQSSVS